MYEVSQSDCGQQERSSRLSERLRGSARWVAAEGSWRVGRTVLTVLTILTAGRVLRLKMAPGRHFDNFDPRGPQAGNFDPRGRLSFIQLTYTGLL